MNLQDKNKGPCFKNHKIDFSKIEWGMKKKDVKRIYTPNYENNHAAEHYIEDGLEFDGDLFDAEIIFFFENDGLYRVSILLDVAFTEEASDFYHKKIKDVLGKMYGQPTQESNDVNINIFEVTEFSIVNLQVSTEYHLLRIERTLFGFNPRLSADFYDSPPDKLIRIIIEKK